MTQIEKIRQEIERLEGIDYPCETSEEATGFYVALDRISSFLDTLQEPEVDDIFKKWGTTEEEYLAKSMDKVRLEMELAAYLQDWQDDEEIGLHFSTEFGDVQIKLDDIRDLARHFAEWGAKNAK